MNIKIFINKIYNLGTPIGEDQEVTEKRILINKYSFWLISLCFIGSLTYIFTGDWYFIYTTIRVSFPFFIIFVIPFLTSSIKILKISFSGRSREL